MSTPNEIALIGLPVAKEAPFKRLKMQHRRVLALHVRGMANMDIDRALNESNGYTGRVLRNPTVVPILDRIYKEYEVEMKGLFPLTVKVLRSALEDGEVSEALRATEIWHKIHGTYDKTKDSATTAEDVIERIMEQVNPDGTKFRVTERRKFIHAPDSNAVQNLDDSPIDVPSSNGDGTVSE